jgi:serine/threonine-protein kinase
VNDRERNSVLKRARQLEQAGQHEQAVALYRRVQAHQEAARVLSGLGRHAEAGNLLLAGLGIKPAAAQNLPGPLRKQAYLAATYLAKGGDIDTAVELFVSLGEFGRGADLLEKAGDLVGAERLRTKRAGFARAAGDQHQRPNTYGGQAVTPASAQKLEAEGKLELAAQCYMQLRRYSEAARIMQNLGQVAEAAAMFAEAGMAYEAAACYLEAGDTGKGLGNLTRVPRDDHRYRPAAIQAIRVAHSLNALNFDVENFLAQFVRTGPENDGELESFFLLSKLYEKQDLLENAKELLRKILEAKPGYRDADVRLATLEDQTQGSQATYERIRNQEESFYETSRAPQRTLDPALTPLPSLDDLEPPQSMASPRRHGQGPRVRGRTTAGTAPARRPAAQHRSAPPVTTSPPGRSPAPAMEHRSAAPAATPHQGKPGLPAQFEVRSGSSEPASAVGTYVMVSKVAKKPPASSPPKQTAPGRERPPSGLEATAAVQPVPSPATNPAGSRLIETPAAEAQAAPPPALATDSGAGSAGTDDAVPVTNSVFATGALVAERYRLEGELGQGGMAIVYRATDLELEEEIALKVFLQQNMGDADSQAEGLARFKQELKLCRQLRHQNIVQLYDIGSHAGYRYITMELLRGCTLEDKLDRILPLGTGLNYLIQSCAGLHRAHEKQVIHRDIKPENLFVTAENVVKVMDFGIAKNWQSVSKTRTGMMAGTPEYMAPEQINSFNKVTAATDLYALGLVAYRMFTNTLPFQHDELVPLLMMHVTQPPASPREHNRELPEELEQAILKLLAKDPTQRFSSCWELAQHLHRIGQKYLG